MPLEQLGVRYPSHPQRHPRARFMHLMLLGTQRNTARPSMAVQYLIAAAAQVVQAAHRSPRKPYCWHACAVIDFGVGKLPAGNRNVRSWQTVRN